MYSPTPPSCPDQGNSVPESSEKFENLEWNGDERHDNCHVDPILRDAAQTAYLGLVDDYTGEAVDQDNWALGYNHARKLEQQSLQIAEAIDRAGGQPWQDRQSLKLVGLCSGQIREIPNVKDWNIFPVVARRKRAAVVKHLNWYMDTSAKRFRMWVFTGGDRFTWINNEQGFDDRMTELTRRISRLNDQDFMKLYGVKIIYRSVEICGDKNGFLRDGNGNPTMHLHAHCMIQMDHKLDPPDWNDLIERVGAYWKHHWKEAGEVRDTREVCKYMNKPADTLKLSDDEILSLAKVCHGRQFCRMSGHFQERCKDLKDSGMRIDFIKDKWVMNPNWNGRTKGARALVELEGDGNDVVDPIVDDPMPTAVAYTKPAPIFVPYREPCVLVANWDGKSELNLTEFGEEVKQSAISIYTTSITVRQEPSACPAGSDPPPF